MKKIIAIILCMAVLLSSFPMAVMAETDAELLARLIADGNPASNTNRDPINIATYKKYDLVVYGDPHGRVDKKGEYEFLGYDKNGNDVTNDAWALLTFGDLTKYNYYIFDGAAGSWKDSGITPEQIDHLFRYKPIMDEMKYVDISVSQILAHKVDQEAAKRGITTEKGKDDIRKQFAMLQVLPSLASHGSVRVMYRTSSGNPMHNTFILERMEKKYNFQCGVTINAGNTYTLQPGQEYIDIPVKLNGSISATGITVAQLITSVSLKFEGATKPGTAASPNATFTKRVYAKDLKVGSNKLNLIGYALYNSKFGDEMTREDSTTITVIKPAPAAPTVEISAKVTPDYIKYESKDIPVTLDVSSELLGYADLANIKEVKIYARFKEDTTAQQLTLTPRLKAEGSFNFTIPKDKVNSDQYAQYFVATVKYIYNKPVNNLTSQDGSTEVSAMIYKVAPLPPKQPEVPKGLKPVADVRVNRVVRAGDDVTFDGSGSYDRDGVIMEYNWTIAEFNGGLVGTQVTGHFAREGTYQYALEVVDDDGMKDVYIGTITVLPPKPVLILKTLGTLKENRKVTLDLTGSSSPTHFPLINEATTISITPVSGGAAQDIKVDGSLNGNMRLDLLFKKAGEYKVAAAIRNTAGYTDQVEVTLTIAEDKEPIADFAVQKIALRDPDDGNKHTLIYTDQSYSPDSDYIANNIYTFFYDNNNNGLRDDSHIKVNSDLYADGETKTINTSWGQAIQVTVEKKPDMPIKVILKGEYVGKYSAELEVTEGFGQETIPKFITAADYRKDDTTDLPMADKSSEVKNVAPVASVEIVKRKIYDFVVVTDYAGDKLAGLQTQLEEMKAAMLEQNVDIKYHYVSSKKKIGKQAKSITDTLYARRAWVTYLETGNEQIINVGNASWVNRPRTDYLNYEQAWSDIPNPLPGFSKPLTYSVTTQGYDDQGMYGRNTGVEHIFYDPNNYSGTRVGIRLDTYMDGMYLGRRVNSYSNITYGMENYWFNTGQTRQKTLYYDVYGVNFDNINSTSFRKGSEKVMLVFSQNDSQDYSYTNPANTGYSFATLTKSVQDFVAKNNMAVYTVVPNSILDTKYNASNNNTDITTQQLSLRELVNSSPVRGKFLGATWKKDLGYITFIEPLGVKSVTIDNNTVTIKLDEPLPEGQDLLLNYIQYLNAIQDEVGNVSDNVSDILVKDISHETGTQELANGLLFEDVVGAAFNGMTRIRIGSPSVPGNRYRYIVGGNTPMSVPAVGTNVSAWTLVTNGQGIAAADGIYIGVAEVDAANRVVRFSQTKAVVFNEN